MMIDDVYNEERFLQPANNPPTPIANGDGPRQIKQLHRFPIWSCEGLLRRPDGSVPSHQLLHVVPEAWDIAVVVQLLYTLLQRLGRGHLHSRGDDSRKNRKTDFAVDSEISCSMASQASQTIGSMFEK